MALPPNIPTSFVPKQPVATQPRRKQANGVVYYASLFIAGVAVVGAGVTFGYQKYNESVRDARKAKLQQAEQNINASAVEDFIRLRNRIRAARTMLDNHIYASQFFDVLEGITLQNVRFQSLIFSIADDRTAKIEMHGVARSFNALAAQSAAFASEKRIKRAIFSDITADKNGIVSFSLHADLDPKLLLRTAVPAVAPGTEPPAVNVATTTPIGPAPQAVGATTTVAPAAKATTTKP